MTSRHARLAIAREWLADNPEATPIALQRHYASVGIDVHYRTAQRDIIDARKAEPSYELPDSLDAVQLDVAQTMYAVMKRNPNSSNGIGAAKLLVTTLGLDALPPRVGKRKPDDVFDLAADDDDDAASGQA